MGLEVKGIGPEIKCIRSEVRCMGLEVKGIGPQVKGIKPEINMLDQKELSNNHNFMYKQLYDCTSEQVLWW